MSEFHELPARGLPMLIATACVRQAVARGDIATCSGQSQDEERRIDRRLCQLHGIKRPGIAEPSIAFTIWRTGIGDDRIYIETAVGVYDHVIGRDDADRFIERANAP